MGNTLEERVDRLIAKSNQELPSNGHVFDRPFYGCNQGPEGSPNLNFQKPWNDIHQNL